MTRGAATSGREPNHDALNGSGIHVTYATTSSGGQPQLTYQDPQQLRPVRHVLAFAARAVVGRHDRGCQRGSRCEACSA